MSKRQEVTEREADAAKEEDNGKKERMAPCLSGAYPAGWHSVLRKVLQHCKHHDRKL